MARNKDSLDPHSPPFAWHSLPRRERGSWVHVSGANAAFAGLIRHVRLGDVLSTPFGTFCPRRAMAAPIFISYAHEDRSQAEQFAARFSASGWPVWWDRQITGGSHFDKATEEAIAAAKVVVVLWSRASVASHWVRAEAAWALAKDKLLPVKIDDVDPPLQFFHVQTIDLVGLNITRETPALRQLLAELAQRLGDGRLRTGSLMNREDRSRGVREPRPACKRLAPRHRCAAAIGRPGRHPLATAR